MKKSLWMLGMAVAALTSCTQSEVLDVAESRVIGFDSHVGKDSRSVTTIDENSLNKFYVYCAKGRGTGTSFTEDEGGHYFNGVEVSKSGDSYSYDHKQWVGSKTFRFAAYSNANETADVTFNNGARSDKWGMTFNNYTVSDKDLIAAIPAYVETGTDLSSMTTVNLGFDHLLARVQVVFYTNIGQGEKLRIKSFNFNGVKTANCTVSLTEGETKESVEWATSGTDGYYVFAKASESQDYTDVEAGTTSVTFETYAIPQSNQSLTIPTITVQTLNASTDEVLNTKTYSDVSLKLTDTSHTSWQPATIYSYQTSLQAESHEIHFSATVNGWDDPAAGDKTFNN